MSIPNPPSRARPPRNPLDTISLMAALLMAGDLAGGAGCCEPDFYIIRALELYRIAQERVDLKLRAGEPGGKP